MDRPTEPLDRKVIGLASVGFGGLLLAAAYQLSDGRIGVPCAFRAATGLDCPLCGSTRMAAALLRGDLEAAWSFNAPMLLIGPVVGLAVGYQLVAWAFRLPRLRMRASTQDLLMKVFLVGMLLFGVLRNL